MSNAFQASSLDEAKYLFEEDLEIWPEHTVLEWTDPETLVPCSMMRSDLGHWCGYVILKNDWISRYNITVDELGLIEKALEDKVHGGVTYAQRCTQSGDLMFGFDCAHLGDYFPRFANHPKISELWPNMAQVGKPGSESSGFPQRQPSLRVWLKAGVDREVTFMAAELWKLVQLYKK